jgi:hypothetical protein
MSLPFFEQFGWHAEVVKIKDEFCDIQKDPLLLKSIPANLIIHEVAALSKKYTSKLGLGSLAIRSLWFYKNYVSKLLTTKQFDLIYFSTTQFPVCILGAYWKKKFGISYIIDMQDPWHSDYYINKPKNERPKKYWFSYRLNKYLEPIAMKSVDGLIAVSQDYIDNIINKYKIDVPTRTITFGAHQLDFDIAKKYFNEVTPLLERSNPNEISIGYIGRGGYDMHDALKILFKAFHEGLKTNPTYFKRIRFYFIGTSYAKNGTGSKTISPLAKLMGMEEYVKEETDRIPFYQTLNTLKSFNLLFICGSNDEQYTASKIYPYILAEKPLLSIFHPKSSAAKIIKDCKAGEVVTFDESEKIQVSKILDYIKNSQEKYTPYLPEAFALYSSKEMTKKQCELFNKVME